MQFPKENLKNKMQLLGYNLDLDTKERRQEKR